MNDLAQAIAEVRRVVPADDALWTINDITHAAQAAIFWAVVSGELIPVQCCMCGKTGLSVAEDGGPECELHDGRWVCSGDCWDKAYALQGGDMIPLADHKLAVALVVEKAAMLVRPIPTEHHCVRVPFYHDTGDIDQSSHLARSSTALADTILTLAPTDSLAEVREWKRLAIGGNLVALEMRQVEARAEAAEAKLAGVVDALVTWQTARIDVDTVEKWTALANAEAGLCVALEGAKP